MLRTRVILGTSLVAAVVGVLVLDVFLAGVLPSDYAPGLYVLVAFVVVAGMREFYRMLRQSGRPCHPVLGTGFALLLLACGFLQRRFPESLSAILKVQRPDMYLAVTVLLIFCLFLTEIRKAELRGGAGPALESVAWTLLGFVYIGFLSLFVIEIRFLPGSALRGAQMLALALGTAKMCDIGAYILGRTVGRHRLTPVLSPAKTVEGAIGGLIFGTAFAAGLGWLWLEMGWWQMAVFGVVVSMAAQAGDLVESLVKRACHAKDSGHVSGFGGTLDILDSILFSVPVAYLLFVLFAWHPAEIR